MALAGKLYVHKYINPLSLKEPFLSRAIMLPEKHFPCEGIAWPMLIVTALQYVGRGSAGRESTIRHTAQKISCVQLVVQFAYRTAMN